MTDEVLLVEDDPATARIATDALVAAGFAVHGVSTGDAALEYATARELVCVVMAAGLTPLDGIETLRRLRLRRLAPPVVVTTRRAAIDVAVRAMKAGAHDVVELRPESLAALVRAVRSAASTSGAGDRGGRLVRPVFIGREHELRFLAGELERARGGQGRVVLLPGESGIGKTSLALELGRTARDCGALVLWGRCDETRGAPAYWPWTEVLRGFASAIDRSVAREALGTTGRAVLSLVPELGAPDHDAAATEPVEVTRFHLFDGVAQFLKRAAERRPVVVVLDDLHQTDGDSLHLLRFLARGIAEARVLVVATYRDVGLEASAREVLAAIADQPATVMLRLGGFDETDVWRYVTEATGVTPPKALVRAIVGRTQGNPLFVADVVSLLAADARLGQDPADGELRLAIPESRRQAIGDRLARLSPECARVLGVAALVGVEVALPLLVRVLDAAAAAVRDAVDEAVTHGLVTIAEPGATFRFANALVRDVLVERLSPSERPRLHARIADALEATGSGRTERPLAAIAHHRLESAAGPEDLARAHACLVAAANRAAELMAHEEAARYYEAAIRVAEQADLGTPSARTEILVELAEARWRAGHADRARAAGRRALDIAKAAADTGAIAAAALAFAGRLPALGAIVCDEEVVAELERALESLPPTATALRALLMARLAEELTYLPRRSADRALAPKAITLARSLDDPAVLASVLRTTQWSVWTPDDVERRRQLAEEIVTLAGRTRDPVLALDGELLRLWNALERAEMDVARRQLMLATRLAERLRLPYYTGVTALARACLHIGAGRLDEGERVADEALRAGDPTSNPTVPLFVGAQRGHIMWHRGRFEELASWLGEVVGTFPMLASAVECSLVITYAEAGQRDLAQAELSRFAADDFGGVPRNAMWLMNMTSLAEGCAAIGDVEAAKRLYPQLAPFARYNVVLVPAWVGAPVAHYMAQLAALLGDGAAARRHFEDALVLEARTGTRQWGARTQLAFARLLRASGRPEDAARAEQLVASAAAIADELGLEPVKALVRAAAMPARASAGAARRCRFHRIGDDWEVEFLGQRAVVRHRVGMDYVRMLLERPGSPVSALQLASTGGRGILVEAGGRPVLDARALTEVHRRIDQIEAELDGCAARGVAPDENLRRELARCRDYLAEQGPELLSAVDRARPSVTKAIDRAIAAVREIHSALGHHLARHVETGRTCVYVPDPADPVRFDL